jgi:hypothetical protein
MEFFGNRQKAAKMSQLHISPSLLITEASTASGPTCFKRAALRKVHIHDTQIPKAPMHSESTSSSIEIKLTSDRRAARRSSFPFLKTWRSLLVDALRYPASSGGAARSLEAR